MREKSNWMLTDRMRGIWLVLVTGIVLFTLTAPVAAHFLLNLNVRIYHVLHETDGLLLHLRTPMPYLVADKVGEEKAEGLPDPAPFTTNAMDDGQVVHFVDPRQIMNDPLGLGHIAEESLLVELDGQRLRGTVEAVSLHVVGSEPGFATLDEARAVFGDRQRRALAHPVYVGDAIVDIRIKYHTDAVIGSYALSSQLDPDLPGQEDTANLILDYGPGQPKVFRTRGLMTEPVEVTRARFTAIQTFIMEGVRHILVGIDHVLFVICLVLGAPSLGNLLSRVTGFTVGHSVTLAFGFFGYVPSGGWFVPIVETGIALSIIYAAVIAIRPGSTQQGGSFSIFFVTVAIGLMHGLSFSFVLNEILKVDSPNIWQSLLAFNVGVELGQILIVVLAYPLVRILPLFGSNVWPAVRVAIAVACIGIASVWTVERAAQAYAALFKNSEAKVVGVNSPSSVELRA